MSRRVISAAAVEPPALPRTARAAADRLAQHRETRRSVCAPPAAERLPSSPIRVDPHASPFLGLRAARPRSHAVLPRVGPLTFEAAKAPAASPTGGRRVAMAATCSHHRSACRSRSAYARPSRARRRLGSGRQSSRSCEPLTVRPKFRGVREMVAGASCRRVLLRFSSAQAAGRRRHGTLPVIRNARPAASLDRDSEAEIGGTMRSGPQVTLTPKQGDDDYAAAGGRIVGRSARALDRGFPFCCWRSRSPTGARGAAMRCWSRPCALARRSSNRRAISPLQRAVARSPCVLNEAGEAVAGGRRGNRPHRDAAAGAPVANALCGRYRVTSRIRTPWRIDPVCRRPAVVRRSGGGPCGRLAHRAAVDRMLWLALSLSAPLAMFLLLCERC